LAGEPADLFYDGTAFKTFTHPRIENPNTHGTGCTLSAALTTFWGQGFPLIEAVEKAKDFITKSIAGAVPIGQGKGPTNPYAWLYREMRKDQHNFT
jgi:hydroxymethylpyrimidine/phosphomethylpyrimidine kinase